MSDKGKPRDKPDPDSGDGLMLRPEAFVLDDQALIPERNLVRPAPNRFTHELVVDEPYRLDRPERSLEPDGVLPAGTLVVLLVDGDDRCRVVDGNGLYVEVKASSLRKLANA